MFNLNSVDTIILLVFFASILVGLMRGFIREIISLFTWIAAFVISILFSGALANTFTGSAASSSTSSLGAGSAHMLALSSCFIGLFVATLIIGSFVGRFISQMVESQGVSLANRFLGALFGFIRGLLVVLLVIFLGQLTPMSSQPAWAQSQFVAAYQPAVKWLDDLVQPGLSSLKSQMGNSMRNVSPGQYIDQLKQNYQDTGASQMFQGK